MKRDRGAMKSLMMAAGLVSLLLVGAGRADAQDGLSLDVLMSRHITIESARPELGQSVSTCWSHSVCLAAVSERGWGNEMKRVQDDMCVLPAPGAPSDKQNNWSAKGLLVIAYEGGLSGKTATISSVLRTGNRLLVDVSLSTRTDGCGYCDQDEVRIARRDLLGVNKVMVRYTCGDCGGPVSAAGSVAEDSYGVGPQGGVGADDGSDSVSWGSLKAMYR